MKRIIIFVLLFAALKVAGQTTGYLRFDTVKIMKQNGTCELYIINKTKDSLGLLTNVGGGLTRFIKSKVLNDSSIIIGLDTLRLSFPGIVTADNGLTKTGNNIQQGGALVKDTDIPNDGFYYFIHGDGQNIFRTTNGSFQSNIATSNIAASLTAANSSNDFFSEVNAIEGAVSLNGGNNSTIYSNIYVSQAGIDLVTKANTTPNLFRYDFNGKLIIGSYGGTNFRTIDTSYNALVIDGSGNVFKRAGGNGGTGVGALSNVGTGFSWATTPNGSIKRFNPTYGLTADSSTSNTISLKVDTSAIATQYDLTQLTTVQVDSLIYTHSSSEVDTLTKTALINKTILQVNAHPYTIFPTTTYAPASDEVFFNSTTGGIKFGTAIQSGQKITIIYKYTAAVGTAAVNSVNGQTGNITIDGGETKVTAGTNTTVTGAGTVVSPYVVNATGGGSGATLLQVDSSVVRAAGRHKAVHLSCILRPTWDGANTTWEVLGQADGHDTTFSPGLSVSVVGSQLRLNYPSEQFVAGMQANGDDALVRNAYSIGPSAGSTFTQFAIWKNFQQTDLWIGADILDGSYSNAPGSNYRVKVDTATGIFTVDIAFSHSGDTLYNCEIAAGNYYDNFPQAHVINYRRATTQQIDFYLIDALTGNRRKGLLTNNDNFYVKVSGRKQVSADVENFGGNAAIFVDGMFITN